MVSFFFVHLCLADATAIRQLFLYLIIKNPMNNKESNTDSDWGFGQWKQRNNSNKNIGNTSVVRTGKQWGYFSFYQYLKTIPSPFFIFLIVLGFTIINTFFAVAYCMVGLEELYGMPVKTGISGFLYAYFFSIQTFTSVGYGGMHPHGLLANFVASINAFVGLLSFAIITGLLFARFSHPTSKILFSQRCLLTHVNGRAALVFRIVNARQSTVFDIKSKVVVSFTTTENAMKIRHFHPLSLERDSIYLFPLNWNLVHFIDENSPLFQKNYQTLVDESFQLVIVIRGFDEAYSQSIYQQHTYTHIDLKQNATFAPMYFVNNDGVTVLELDKLNELIEI